MEEIAAEILEPVILIKINRLYQEGMTNDELYHITRGKWRVGERRNSAKYALAVHNKIIKEAYEIDHWAPIRIESSETVRSWERPGSASSIVKEPNRWQFTGRIAEELQHYIGKSIVNYVVPGAANSIRYVNC